MLVRHYRIQNWWARSLAWIQALLLAASNKSFNLSKLQLLIKIDSWDEMQGKTSNFQDTSPCLLLLSAEENQLEGLRMAGTCYRSWENSYYLWDWVTYHSSPWQGLMEWIWCKQFCKCISVCPAATARVAPDLASSCLKGTVSERSVLKFSLWTFQGWLAFKIHAVQA